MISTKTRTSQYEISAESTSWKAVMHKIICALNLTLACVIPYVACKKNSPQTELSETGNSGCSLRTYADWQNFLNTSAQALTTDDPEDSQGLGSRVIFAKAVEIGNTLESCKAIVTATPQLAACTTHLKGFALASQRRNTRKSMGFNFSNAAYLSRQEDPSNPNGMMEFPEVLKKGHQTTLGALEAVAKKNDWAYAIHKSGLISGARFFLYIPGSDFDKFIIYDTDETGSLKTFPSYQNGNPTYPSLITVQKKDKDGNILMRPKLHFRDVVLGGEIYLGKGKPNANSKCYSCHPSGLRPLIPYTSTFTAADALPSDPPAIQQMTRAERGMARVLEFNKIFESYGNVEFNDAYIPEEHGPPLGKAQGCTDCHDGQTRGILNYSTQISQIEEKMVGELLMPFSDHALQMRVDFAANKLDTLGLSKMQQLEDTNSRLFEGYVKDRVTTTRQWLLATSCGGSR